MATLSMSFSFLLLAVFAADAADDVLIYRCTDANGHETYQDSACPQNSFQHVIRMQRPAETLPKPAPAAPKAAAATVPAEGSEAPPPEPPKFSLPPWETEESMAPPPAAPPPPTFRPGPRPSPPPLWRCRGLDKKAYISETAKPPPKCIALTELGINLDAVPKEMRTGCQNVHDACDRLADVDACQHYGEQRAVAELALGGSPPQAQALLRAEFERLDRIWQESCAP